MKRRKVMIALLVAILLFSSIGQAIGYADSGNKTIQVGMNGTKVSVTQVPIIMDGQVVNTEFPSFVHTNRTLIPVRFVSEHYGAKVDWDQKTKTAIVTHGDKEGRFTLDSNIAMINGEKRILDKYAIPKLATLGTNEPRTMIPLAFITDIFGFEVGWNDEKRAPYINSKKEEGTISLINDISVEKHGKSSKIMLSSDSSLEYDTLFLQDIGIFILDIKDSKLSIKDQKDSLKTINIDDNNIDKIEYSQFSKEPSITRVVVHLKQEIKNTISPGPDNKGLIILFGDNIEGEDSHEDAVEGIISSKNRISSITKEFINGREALVIYGGTKESINIIELKNPERIVVDLVDAILEGATGYDLDYNLDFIKKVRVSQFLVDENYKETDQVVRVVLDIKEGVFDPEIKIVEEDNKVIIYPEKSVWENLKYTSEGKYRNLTVANLSYMDYSLNYMQDSRLLAISIPTDQVDLNEGVISINDGLIDEIQVIKGRNNTEILIKCMRNIEYNVLEDEENGKLTLIMERGDILSPKDRIIVIDPGHGGKQPGTTSVTGVREKDFNLTVSLQLEKKLRELGYNIVMTRDTDTTLGLYERSDIANAVNADLFVSIHGNAHDNRSIAGVQVLYCPATESSKKEVDQHPFAKIMMEEMLKGTGAADKGIVKRPKIVVLRETKMPAVLVEAGFMSNAAEEKLLLTPAYQEKIVNSIINGIEKYFEMY